MGQGYLMDTNVVIDYLGNKLPLSGTSFIDNLPVVISVITRIEILGWYNATSEQLAKLKLLFRMPLFIPLLSIIFKKPSC